MQIVLKLEHAPIDLPDLSRQVADAARRIWSDGPRVTVQQVFPGISKGNRARMYVVNIEGAPQEADRLVRALSDIEGVEYASVPSEKQPM